mmetsp:Transcript_98528/g.234626  ORF Transcript_98528/g.234626 Transcript_98528/m.234626 type:complete len:245 (-) Transcript_98528:3535-4269(-)
MPCHHHGVALHHSLSVLRLFLDCLPQLGGRFGHGDGFENLAHGIKVLHKQVDASSQVFRSFTRDVEVQLGLHNVGDEIDVGPQEGAFLHHEEHGLLHLLGKQPWCARPGPHALLGEGPVPGQLFQQRLPAGHRLLNLLLDLPQDHVGAGHHLHWQSGAHTLHRLLDPGALGDAGSCLLPVLCHFSRGRRLAVLPRQQQGRGVLQGFAGRGVAPHPALAVFIAGVPADVAGPGSQPAAYDGAVLG